MLALVEREKLTVAQLGRIIGISRQGAHKCAKSLIERGYLTIENKNSRDKELLLTDKGMRFCRETLILKEKFEEEIKNNIGEKEFEVLKKCLNKDWFWIFTKKLLKIDLSSFLLVPDVGLEPTRYCYQRILSPSRLPFHQSGLIYTKL